MGGAPASYVGVSGVGDDHRAFLDATLPHVDVVFQVARHAAGDGQEPEDLVQETYLRAYAAFGSYRVRTRGRGWPRSASTRPGPMRGGAGGGRRRYRPRRCWMRCPQPAIAGRRMWRTW